jgi:hypothetical protein
MLLFDGLVSLLLLSVIFMTDKGLN